MKLRIVANIAIQRTIISIKPMRGDLSLKNATDHNTFRTSWAAKIYRAVLTFSSSFRQTRNNEIPIIINRDVHTGKNTQLGGAKEGF